jgi:hypothetical protein
MSLKVVDLITSHLYWTLSIMTGLSDVSLPGHGVLEFRFLVHRARAATYNENSIFASACTCSLHGASGNYCFQIDRSGFRKLILTTSQ